VFFFSLLPKREERCSSGQRIVLGIKKDIQGKYQFKGKLLMILILNPIKVEPKRRA
jgi:hypothetical protein